MKREKKNYNILLFVNKRCHLKKKKRMHDENNTWRPHFKSLHSLSLSLSVLKKKKCSKVYNDSILASFLNIDVIQPELLECIRTIPNLQFVHRCFVVVQHNFSVYKSGGTPFCFCDR